MLSLFLESSFRESRTKWAMNISFVAAFFLLFSRQKKCKEKYFYIHHKRQNRVLRVLAKKSQGCKMQMSSTLFLLSFLFQLLGFRGSLLCCFCQFLHIDVNRTNHLFGGKFKYFCGGNGEKGGKEKPIWLVLLQQRRQWLFVATFNHAEIGRCTSSSR